MTTPQPGDIYELPEPPVGTILRDRSGEEMERLPDGWWLRGWGDDPNTLTDRLPWLDDPDSEFEAVTEYMPLTVVRWGQS